VALTCWVCKRAIEAGQAQLEARGLPRRLRRFEGHALHLRCQGEWRDVFVEPAPARRRAAGRQDPGPQPPTAKLLFAEDFARRFGVSRWTARRRLQELERQFGAQVVGRVSGRRGPRRYTTETALRSIGPAAADDDMLETLLRKIDALEELVVAHGCAKGA
jgi:hypothetical protein